MNQNYFIIGGSNLQINFINKVKEMGFITHVFDYNPNCSAVSVADFFHCVSIDDKETILEIAKQYRPIAIQSVATELGNITACYIGEKLGLNTNSYEVALNTTNKARMKEVLRKNSLPTAKYQIIKNIADVNIDTLNYPLVVKPSDQSASRGVTLVKNKEKFLSAYELAKKESRNQVILLEEVLYGKQYSVETITCNGNHKIVAFTEEFLIDSDDFVECHQLVPARFSQQQEQHLTELIYLVLDAFSITFGASHIELKLTDSGFQIIEIASRMGGWRDMLIKLALNCDYNELLVGTTLNNEIDFKFSEKCFAIIKLVFTQKDFDFYKKLQSTEPEIIIHTEVQEFEAKEFNSLAQAQGFYYIKLPYNANINSYLEELK